MFGSGVPAVLTLLPDTFTFAWLVAILFAVAWLLDSRGLAAGRSLAAGTWALFGLFWLTTVPYFAFEHQSYVESILALVGVRPVYTPATCCTTGGGRCSPSRERSRDHAVHLPPVRDDSGVHARRHGVPPEPRRILIEAVATQTGMLIDLLGYVPERVASSEGYNAAYLWTLDDGHTYRIDIVLACTGLGSMAIFGGLVAAVEAPLRRRKAPRARGVGLAHLRPQHPPDDVHFGGRGQPVHAVVPGPRVGDVRRERPLPRVVPDLRPDHEPAARGRGADRHHLPRRARAAELVVILEDVLYLLTGAGSTT